MFYKCKQHHDNYNGYSTFRLQKQYSYNCFYIAIAITINIYILWRDAVIINSYSYEGKGKEQNAIPAK